MRFMEVRKDSFKQRLVRRLRRLLRLKEDKYVVRFTRISNPQVRCEVPAGPSLREIITSNSLSTNHSIEPGEWLKQSWWERRVLRKPQSYIIRFPHTEPKETDNG